MNILRGHAQTGVVAAVFFYSCIIKSSNQYNPLGACMYDSLVDT